MNQPQMDEDKSKDSAFNKKLPSWIAPLLVIFLVLIIFLVLELIAGSGGFRG
jgi:hypothetical protein